MSTIDITLMTATAGGGVGGGAAAGSGAGPRPGKGAGGADESTGAVGSAFVAKVTALDGQWAACVWSDRRMDVREGVQAASAACRRSV